MGHSLASGDNLLHAFRWEDGQMTRLPVSGWSNYLPMDINDSGQIVTIQEDQQNQVRRLFLVEGEEVTLIAEEGLSSNAVAINDLGQVVYNTLDTGTLVAHVWEREGGAQLLTGPGFLRSSAVDLNNAGDIVGQATSESKTVEDSGNTFNPPFGALWRDGTGYDLNDLVPAGTPEITDAVAVGGTGHILVIFLASDGNSSQGLLTPKDLSSS